MHLSNYRIVQKRYFASCVATPLQNTNYLGCKMCNMASSERECTALFCGRLGRAVSLLRSSKAERPKGGTPDHTQDCKHESRGPVRAERSTPQVVCSRAHAVPPCLQNPFVQYMTPCPLLGLPLPYSPPNPSGYWHWWWWLGLLWWSGGGLALLLWWWWWVSRDICSDPSEARLIPYYISWPELAPMSALDPPHSAH